MRAKRGLPTAVYHSFKNKKEILHTIFSERWSRFIEAVEGIAESSISTREKLVSIAALVLHARRLRPAWVNGLVLEIQRTSRFSELNQIHWVAGSSRGWRSCRSRVSARVNFARKSIPR